MFGPVGGRPQTRAAHRARRAAQMARSPPCGTTSCRTRRISRTTSSPSALSHAHAVRVPERHDDAPARQAQRRHADLPARAGRGDREVRARVARWTSSPYALKLDPVELRLRNYAETDADSGKPLSSKHLRECYRRPPSASAGRGGRGSRARCARATRSSAGAWRTATYPAHRMAGVGAAPHCCPTAAVRRAIGHAGPRHRHLHDDDAGRRRDARACPSSHVRFELGDTAMPQAPVSGGSMTAASVGPAVQAACQKLRAQLIERAVADPQLAAAWLAARARRRSTRAGSSR